MSTRHNNALTTRPSLPTLPKVSVPQAKRGKTPSHTLCRLRHILLHLLLLSKMPRRSPHRRRRHNDNARRPSNVYPRRCVIRSRRPCDHRQEHNEQANVLFRHLLFRPTIITLLHTSANEDHEGNTRSATATLTLTNNQEVPREDHLHRPNRLGPTPS